MNLAIGDGLLDRGRGRAPLLLEQGVDVLRAFDPLPTVVGPDMTCDLDTFRR